MKNFDQWAEDLAEHIRKKEEKKTQKEVKIVPRTISGTIISGGNYTLNTESFWENILNLEIQNYPLIKDKHKLKTTPVKL